ncbi:hypothetical protein Clacol_006253 [Clathrus columnatus]|uniref:Uncharacterized protein n=1 Tax=Clathrus columnatus TaxID=1419009 RepID=A0AAV5ACE7_9AGAM|nr:hypothetical protein Clacol_006253 [Clathrus columnatus]
MRLLKLIISCVFIFPHLAVADHDSNSVARRHSSLVHRKRLLSDPLTHQPEKRGLERLTWYNDGLGACGIVNTPEDFIVALNSDQFGGGYPGPHCFQTITIDCNGVQRQALITDECPGCPPGGLDLSTSLFQQFAPLLTLSPSLAMYDSEDPSYAVPPRSTDQGVIAAESNKLKTSHHWESFDEFSSDDDDEVLWTGNEFDSDEDFVLVPHMRANIKPSSTPRYDDAVREVIQGITQLSFSETNKVSASTKTDGRNIAVEAKNVKKIPVVKEEKSLHRSNSHSKRNGNAKAKSAAAPLATVSVQSQKQPQQSKVKGSRRKKGGKTILSPAVTYPTPTPSPKGDCTDRVPSKHAEFRFGSPPLIELDTEVGVNYEGAVSFITSFLNAPTVGIDSSRHTRLTFLQSLIIELGLMPTSSALPASLNAATRFLKTHAFLNIRDYLSVRHEGLERLQQIMFKDKRALAKDLRKNKGRRQVDRTWAKEHGLNVFLVSMA